MQSIMDPHCFSWVSIPGAAEILAEIFIAQLCVDLASVSSLHTGIESFKRSMVKRTLSAL